MNERDIKELVHKTTITYLNNILPRFQEYVKTPDYLFTREGRNWEDFEEENLIENFQSFCDKQGLKFGRSPLSISCKIRHLMNDCPKKIKTW